MIAFDGIAEVDWMEELDEMSEWNTRHLLSAFALLGIPKSLLDIGCGNGTMVHTARSLGVEALGVDQLVQDDWGEWFIRHNLVNAYKAPRPAEQVWCIEVAEHLDSTAHATLCDTLIDNLQDHGILVFSAAHPNQGGMGHVAERPARYWMDQFSLRSLSYNQVKTVQLSLLWGNIGSPLYWLPANIQVYEK